MWKVSGVVVVVVLLGIMMESDAKKPRRRKPQKPATAVPDLRSLTRNISSLWAELDKKLESRVVVHVHGDGDDSAEKQMGEDGTHVHIHLNVNDHHGGRRGHDDHFDHYEDDCDEEHHHDSHEDHAGHAHNDSHEDHDHHGHRRGCRGRKHDEYIYARCNVDMRNEPVKSGPRNNITGTIYLRQKFHGPLEILLHLRGFYLPSDHSDHAVHMHAFHVHEFGDFSNGCTSSSGHFNPLGASHGGHDSKTRHAGDWGNIACDDAGEVHMNMTDKYCDLYGPRSIIGRGLVIHETADHLGQAPTGKKKKRAGYGNACCTVARIGKVDWDMLLQHKS
ncbi:uncharacterized protein [Haliotis asinina]|uniref:uncharacterized protein n=1 Tax=Haliotis asinina TaxID=109174 RepID=UPI003531CB7A